MPYSDSSMENRCFTIDDNFFAVVRRQFSVALMELASMVIYDVTE